MKAFLHHRTASLMSLARNLETVDELLAQNPRFRLYFHLELVYSTMSLVELIPKKLAVLESSQANPTVVLGMF